MPERLDEQSRKDKLHQWRAQQRAAARPKLPFADEQMRPRRLQSANDSWIIEAGGDVIQKRAEEGMNALSAKEALIYWFWWADYMLRNAGDFENAVVLEKDFQQEIVIHAKQLGLRYTQETFAPPRSELQSQYLDRFEAVCDEIKKGSPTV